ncbi:MerR family transcriptional regulator [uncultured Flavobacterium sp.]|uniref:MerR family transcriptional regulator n=1 Tax=uncultured Flavobacterium sp. TaxID=165435 RepID=UPI0030C8BCD5
MNNVKNVFSIKDLENLSGIKAHTIRIWEKRYNILEPMRTDTNIRCYDIKNLQKLLNIVLLHNYGYKISKIAQLAPEEIPLKVKEIISQKSANVHAIKSFKMAMMNFDQTLFFKTYNELLTDKSFREVFYEVFLPLMEEIGFLWQTETITPAHEHFISYLIKQKLLSETEKIQSKEATKHDKVFILYLPLNEIHELGLMYVNFELLHSGYKTIFLGENLPIENLLDLKGYYDKITFVSYLTVEPPVDELENYIDKVNAEILSDNIHDLILLGRMTLEIDENKLPEKIKIHKSIFDFISNL